MKIRKKENKKEWKGKKENEEMNKRLDKIILNSNIREKKLNEGKGRVKIGKRKNGSYKTYGKNLRTSNSLDFANSWHHKNNKRRLVNNYFIIFFIVERYRLMTLIRTLSEFVIRLQRYLFSFKARDQILIHVITILFLPWGLRFLLCRSFSNQIDHHCVFPFWKNKKQNINIQFVYLFNDCNKYKRLLIHCRHLTSSVPRTLKLKNIPQNL